VRKETPVADEKIVQLAINTIRTLAMDAVQQARSGHPGAPMALAPAAYCLWQRFLRFDPEHPIWPNRDRFVLSVGHASTPGWARYVGSTGHTIGMETFGASAPLKELQRNFGFTPESIVAAARAQLAQGR
jgi:transketolase